MTLLPHVPTILLLFGSRSYGSPAAPLISSVPLCFCCMCEWIDDWSNGLGLENTSHVGTATTFAQEKTLPTCNVLSDLRIPHHVSPLQKVEEAENTLGKTTNFKCFSWISCNGSHVKVQVSADSVRYSDIPMTIFAPPITGQSSQDLCLE